MNRESSKPTYLIPRIYQQVILDHFRESHEMLFLAGPRQVGKTTTSLETHLDRDQLFYFNWDNQDDQKAILNGPAHIAELISLDKARSHLPTTVFDELHKYSHWKTFLKGFYDTYGRQTRIVVTGSARMDVYRRGGDSLMGRYFLYRLHPLSVAELLDPTIPSNEVRPAPRKMDPNELQALLEYGGFPAPFQRQDSRYLARWRLRRFEQLFREDLRDLTRIQEVKQLELLAELLRYQIGQLTSYASFAKKIRVAVDTVRRWLETLQSLYYCFAVRPWTKNVSRSLLKEPKFYLYDWSQIEDAGARLENFVASHLLKATEFWTDHGYGIFGLFFLRTKEKKEVDFLVSRNGKPWFLVEVKNSHNRNLSPQLRYFQQMIGASHAFQVAWDLEHADVDCFSYTNPVIVPASTFLAQLI